MDFRQTLFKPHWSLSVVRPTKKCLPSRIQNKECLDKCVWGHIRTSYVSISYHLILNLSFSGSPNDKSCTLNFRYSGTPNIPSLFYLKDIHVTSLMNFQEHYLNHSGITTPPVFQKLPLPIPCSSHDHPCLASCSKAARYAARAKPRNAGCNIYW